MYAVKLLTERLEDKAEKWFRITAEITENAPEPHWGIAEIYRRRRLFSESMHILEGVIEEKPDFAPALITKAYIHFEKENYPESVRIANHIISKGDKIDRANLVRAHLIAGGAMGAAAMESFIFGQISRGLKARNHLRQARNLDSEYPGVLFAWGSYYLDAPRMAGGDISKAKRYLHGALEKDPGFADIHATLARLYFIDGDMDLYEKYYMQAVNLDPENRIIKRINKLKK